MTVIKVGFAFLFAMGIMLVYLFIQPILRLWFHKKARLRSRSFLKLGWKPKVIGDRPQWMVKLDRVISVAGHTFTGEVLILICIIFIIPGFLWGMETFDFGGMGVIFGIITGCLPIVYIIYRSYMRQKEMSSLMMPTFQIFLGVYSSHPNIRVCLQQCTPLLPSYIRFEFQILTNSIHAGISLEEALIEFGERVGNPFAEDFADLLITADDRGENITTSLMSLINRTQSHKFNDEMERTELIDIRYGTIVIIAITLFLIAYNIHLGESPFQSTNTILHYYTRMESGQTVIAMVVLVQFVSFMGSLWIGRRKV
jgi:hypothetical protein